MNEKTEDHVCCYCGQKAVYQFKNGKWCCSKNMNSCPEIKRQRKEESLKAWQKIKSQGYRNFNEAPNKQKELRRLLENEVAGICAYCGRPAKFQLKNKKWCCEDIWTKCPANKKKNSEIIKSLYSKNEDGLTIFNDKIKQGPNWVVSKEARSNQGWAKGLTSETSNIINKIHKRLKERYSNGELIPAFKDHHHTTESKNKIVYGMTHFKVNKNNKGHKRGWYKGYWVDSSWELAFVLYNLDHKISFERNYDGFDYNDDGKVKRFYPDFIVNNEYIEIKGFHSSLVDKKISQFPKDKTLKILYKQEMIPYLEYAKSSYGKEFWNLLRSSNEESLQS